MARSPGVLITAVRAAARRPALRGVSNVGDVALALAVTIAAVITAARGVLYIQHVSGAIELPGATYLPGPPPAQPHLLKVPSWALAGVLATTAPLAFRRTYPTSALGVILVAFIATGDYSTLITVGAAIFAAYSAVAYSRHRRITLVALLAGVIIITVAYPQATTQVAARYTPLLVLLPIVAAGNMMYMWRERASASADRLRLVQAAREAEIRRALETERARIASELHDVVTHNVSVMVVQAGAARAVLDGSPGEEASSGGEARLVREAMLAVEASGRTAMIELRHLLGLLVPAEQADGELHPQPGLDQAAALVDRVRAAGLEAELSVTGIRRALEPGLDLAAYRVIQEALTNVIKHAGQARTVVQVEYRPRELLITVANEGRPDVTGRGRGVPVPDGPGGRGLIGLRERVAVHRGELDTGPRPGGGWQVRARIPLESPAGGPEQAPAYYQAASS